MDKYLIRKVMVFTVIGLFIGTCICRNIERTSTGSNPFLEGFFKVSFEPRTDNRKDPAIFDLNDKFRCCQGSDESSSNIFNNWKLLSKRLGKTEQKQNNASITESNLLANNIHPTGYIPPDKSELVEGNLEGGNSLSSWDWRNFNRYDWTTSAKNQGICGCCWSFAANGALEAVINIEENNPSLDIDLSEQYILSCHPTLDCNGGNAYRVFEYMYDHGGALPESCFPYLGDDTIPCNNKCSDWESKLVPILDYSASYSSDLNAIKNLIVGKPVCLSFIVYKDFNYPSSSWDNNGVYKYDNYSDLIGFHEVTVVGYKDTPSNPLYEGYWICKNSWGNTWGPWNNGFFGIAYETCDIDNDVTWVEYESEGYKEIGLIDQKQTQMNSSEVLCNSWMWAQSFKPSLNTLTKVEMLVGKSYGIYNLTVSIKTDLNGNDLTSASKYSSQIPRYRYEWIEFDFPDISITPGQTYYIVCNTTGGDNETNYSMICRDSDVYSMGDAWIGWNSGKHWEIWDTQNLRDVIWDNFLPSGIAYSSQLDDIYPFNSQIADDFMFDEFMQVEEVKWWGDFWNGSAIDTVDFNIFIYADDGFGSQPTGAGMDNPEVTALASYFISAVPGVVDDTGYYTYETVLDPPFQAQADVKYWIAIQSVLTSPPQWGWVNTDEIHLQESVQGFPFLGMPYWTGPTNSVDMAFTLTGQEYGVTDKFDFCFKTFNGNTTNHIPNKPNKPSGPINGKIGTKYTYTTSAIDQDGHKIQYYFDWGDNTGTWTEYKNSGETISLSHSWSYLGNYTIKVKARDEYCSEGNWETFEVSIQKNKAINTPFQTFLENHPHLFPLLRLILRL